ncbi:hypothetical protein B279_02770 [Streptococcus equinus ATCC 33317]|nr:hypothetical protein B279_02770 [Streptococcus equinus ATCC 33317]
MTVIVAKILWAKVQGRVWLGFLELGVGNI